MSNSKRPQWEKLRRKGDFPEARWLPFWRFAVHLSCNIIFGRLVWCMVLDFKLTGPLLRQFRWSFQPSTGFYPAQSLFVTKTRVPVGALPGVSLLKQAFVKIHSDHKCILGVRSSCGWKTFFLFKQLFSLSPFLNQFLWGEFRWCCLPPPPPKTRTLFFSYPFLETKLKSCFVAGFGGLQSIPETIQGDGVCVCVSG